MRWTGRVGTCQLHTKSLPVHMFTAQNTGFPGRSRVWLKFTPILRYAVWTTLIPTPGSALHAPAASVENRSVSNFHIVDGRPGAEADYSEPLLAPRGQRSTSRAATAAWCRLKTRIEASRPGKPLTPTGGALVEHVARLPTRFRRGLEAGGRGFRPALVSPVPPRPARATLAFGSGPAGLIEAARTKGTP